MVECSWSNWGPHLPYLLSSFIVLVVADLTLYATGKNRSRWFKLHVLANICTGIFSYPDFAVMFLNPLVDPSTLNSSAIPPNMTLALHLYHMLLFRNLTVIDWVHHIVMMFVLSLAYTCPNPCMTNYNIFIVNGLPGGIDYFLLILVKDGIMNRITEKKINSKLNVWIRGPGILIGAYIVYLQWRYSVIQYSIYLLMLVIAGLYWNAQYFTERVVYNWGKQHALKVEGP